MDAKAIVAVSTSVVMLLQVLKASGLAGRWGLLVAGLLSIAGVAIWGYSAGTFSRATAWDFTAGWIAVFSSASGVFAIVNRGAQAVEIVKGAPAALYRSLTGTGR